MKSSTFEVKNTWQLPYIWNTTNIKWLKQVESNEGANRPALFAWLIINIKVAITIITPCYHQMPIFSCVEGLTRNTCNSTTKVVLQQDHVVFKSNGKEIISATFKFILCAVNQQAVIPRWWWIIYSEQKRHMKASNCILGDWVLQKWWETLDNGEQWNWNADDWK